MTIQIRATFAGQDGSCGYEHGKQYRLEVSHLHGQPTIVICKEPGANTQMAEYESALSFLENWTSIQGLDQKLDIKQFNNGVKHAYKNIQDHINKNDTPRADILKVDIATYIQANS
jgi:hypothetical protein